MAKRVVVTQIAIEAGSIGHELLPIFIGKPFDCTLRAIFQLVKVLVYKVSLEEAEKDGRLIADLVHCHESSGP